MDCDRNRTEEERKWEEAVKEELEAKTLLRQRMKPTLFMALVSNQEVPSALITTA